MRSKWEYIRDACRELGYEEAAGIADEIEIMLKEIYGDTKTIAWMRDYIVMKEECLTGRDIYILAGNPDYCIGCVEDVKCNNCRFAAYDGVCVSSGSLFQHFIDALRSYIKRDW